MAELNLTNVGVEVGVQEGRFSAHLLTHWPGVLHCVDPWREFPDWDDIANVSQAEQEATYLRAQLRLAPWNARCRIHRLTSIAGAALLGDATLDFVYLDARHDASSVLSDLTAWAPKLKPGGLLAGHDYLDGCYHFQGFDKPTVFGVKTAVHVWGAANGYALAADLHVTTDDPFPTWYLRTA